MRRTILSCLTAFVLSAGLASAVYALPQDAHPVKKGSKSKKVKTGIHWTISPNTVEIYLDGKREGIAKDVEYTKTKPGMHSVRLVNGEDETEFDVMIKKGQIVQLRHEFTDL